MNNSQIVIIIFITIVMILAIWNLVLAIQNLKLEKYKKEEENKDYYGRLK